MSDPVPNNEKPQDVSSATPPAEPPSEPAPPESPKTPDGPVYRSKGGKYDAPVNVHLYDFKTPVFFTEAEFRQLKQTHDLFIQYLEARLALLLRMDMPLTLLGIETISYDALRSSIQSPACVTLFNLEGLHGVGLLSITTTLAMTLVNRMLGGKSNGIKESRGLTEIETGLMDEVIHMILNEWSQLWTEFHFKPNIIGKESDPRFLQTTAKDTLMMVVEFQLKIGDADPEKIKLAFPYPMIDPIIKYLQKKANQHVENNSAKRQPRWIDTYRDIPVPVYAEWNVREMSVRDVLNLSVGDVLEMPLTLLSQTQIRVIDDSPSFLGEVGIDGDTVAVRISKKLKEEYIL